eukprot:SAG11_NODE_3679_length_2291_cov_2.268704_1_plen_622_part_01
MNGCPVKKINQLRPVLEVAIRLNIKIDWSASIKKICMVLQSRNSIFLQITEKYMVCPSKMYETDALSHLDLLFSEIRQLIDSLSIRNLPPYTIMMGDAKHITEIFAVHFCDEVSANISMGDAAVQDESNDTWQCACVGCMKQVSAFVRSNALKFRAANPDKKPFQNRSMCSDCFKQHTDPNTNGNTMTLKNGDILEPTEQAIKRRVARDKKAKEKKSSKGNAKKAQNISSDEASAMITMMEKLVGNKEVSSTPEPAPEPESSPAPNAAISFAERLKAMQESLSSVPASRGGSHANFVESIDDTDIIFGDFPPLKMDIPCDILNGKGKNDVSLGPANNGAGCRTPFAENADAQPIIPIILPGAALHNLIAPVPNYEPRPDLNPLRFDFCQSIPFHSLQPCGHITCRMVADFVGLNRVCDFCGQHDPDCSKFYCGACNTDTPGNSENRDDGGANDIALGHANNGASVRTPFAQVIHVAGCQNCRFRRKFIQRRARQILKLWDRRTRLSNLRSSHIRVTESNKIRGAIRVKVKDINRITNNQFNHLRNDHHVEEINFGITGTIRLSAIAMLLNLNMAWMGIHGGENDIVLGPANNGAGLRTPFSELPDQMQDFINIDDLACANVS